MTSGAKTPDHDLADLVDAFRDAVTRVLSLPTDANIEREDAARFALLARFEAMRGALEWYSENARLCRLIHSEGDAGRHALAADGGKRAQATLSQVKPKER